MPAIDHSKGLLLAAIGGVAITVDIPLIRLADGNAGTVLLLRSATTLVASLAIWLAWRWWRGDAPALIPGKIGLLVAALYGLGSVFFVLAVHHTSTANLVFILALNTMFAAVFSWAFLGERPGLGTIAAMALMLVGLLIIVGDGVGSGNLFGDLLALGSALVMAAAITLTRSSGRDMGFAALVAVALPLLFSIVLVSSQGFAVSEPWWMILNGAIIMPISFFCLALAPKYISAPEVAMFYLLETIFAPVWVWFIFSEQPSTNVLIGGTIMVVTLIVHAIWQIREDRRRRVGAIAPQST